MKKFKINQYFDNKITLLGIENADDVLEMPFLTRIKIRLMAILASKSDFRTLVLKGIPENSIN